MLFFKFLKIIIILLILLKRSNFFCNCLCVCTFISWNQHLDRWHRTGATPFFTKGVGPKHKIYLLITMLYQWSINFIANLSHFSVIDEESAFSYAIGCFGQINFDDFVAKWQENRICRFRRNCWRGTQENPWFKFSDQ